MDTLSQEHRYRYKNIKSGNILECCTGFASLSLQKKMVGSSLQVNSFFQTQNGLRHIDAML